MKEFQKTTLRLTIVYSLIFFIFIWGFSAGIYLWTNNALGEGYLSRINELIEASSINSLPDNTASIAADVALDRMRNIILIINTLSLVAIPPLAYFLSKRSLRPLIKSQEEQRDFITSASHELRTPLAVIAGELEIGGKPHKSAKEYQETIHNTLSEVNRMSELVQQLLYLSRISSESTLKNIKKIAVNELINEVCEFYKHKAKEKNISIKSEPHSIHKILNGQYELLTVAIGNLLDNAIKFSPNKSTVLIEIEEQSNELNIAISNSGLGITTDKIKHVFERFYQSESSHSTNGYGLGLAIAKQAIELHGGKINAASSPNQTTFTISLPLK